MLQTAPSPSRKPIAEDVERLVATLEEDIVLGLLVPGMRLVEDEWMERFGVKRHVVRDVFLQLEHAGLVERRRNVGAQVKAFTAAEVQHLYDMRLLLEAEAMRRLVLPVAEPALDALMQIQAQHDRAIAQEDVRQVFRANHAFHRAIFALCANPFLTQSIEDFARRTHAIRFGALLSRERQLQSQKEHHEIIDALRQGQRQRLVKLARQHIVPPRDQYLTLRQSAFDRAA